jgi:hypothetical protein
MSDAIIFALLFATFVVMSHNTADGPGGHTLFRLSNTFAETVLLLASSATFGFASVAIATGQRWRTLAWLSVTFLLGLGFVAMKVSELYGMAVTGAGPVAQWFSLGLLHVGWHPRHSRQRRPALDRPLGMRGSVARTEPIRRLPPQPAGSVLAFTRYRLDQHLLRRLSAGFSLACEPRRNSLRCRPRRTAGKSRLNII